MDLAFSESDSILGPGTPHISMSAIRKSIFLSFHPVCLGLGLGLGSWSGLGVMLGRELGFVSGLGLWLGLALGLYS